MCCEVSHLSWGPFTGSTILHMFLPVLAITARSSRCTSSSSPVPCSADMGTRPVLPHGTTSVLFSLRMRKKFTYTLYYVDAFLPPNSEEGTTSEQWIKCSSPMCLLFGVYLQSIGLVPSLNNSVHQSWGEVQLTEYLHHIRLVSVRLRMAEITNMQQHILREIKIVCKS